MKLFLLLAATLFSGCAALKQDPLIYFRGEYLGSKPSPTMSKLEKWNQELEVIIDEASDGYIKANEPKKFGSLKIKDVIYHYYQSKLYKIEIRLTPSQCADVDEIKSALESAYGIEMLWPHKNYVDRSFIAQWRGRSYWVTYMCFANDSRNTIYLNERNLQREVDETLRAANQLKMIQRAREIEADLR